MRTIDKYLKYHFTSEEIEALLSCGMINWCGGDKGFNFDNFIEWNLQHLSIFDEDKINVLRGDLRRVCYEHDLDYRLKKNFYISNFSMCYKIWWILHWTPWQVRYGASIGIFLGLCKYGKKYYLK